MFIQVTPVARVGRNLLKLLDMSPHHLNIAVFDRAFTHQLGIPLEADVLANCGSFRKVVVFIEEIGKVGVGESEVEFDFRPCVSLISDVFELNTAVVQQVAALGTKSADVPVAEDWL